MTVIAYIKESGACTTAELMAFAREDKSGFETLKRWAREEMANKGVVIDEQK